MTGAEQIAELLQELASVRQQLKACLAFLVTEMQWEEFRVEMLYADDEPKRVASEENARRLRNFLVEMKNKRTEHETEAKP
jgi:hypothetical protein